MNRPKLAPLALALLVPLAATGCRRRVVVHRTHAAVTSASVAGPKVTVARAATAPKIDGEVDAVEWTGAARTPAFAKDGQSVHPYSDARFLWRDDLLFVALYAADEDIRERKVEHDAPIWLDDAFRLRFETPVRAAIDVAPSGAVTDARMPRSGPLDFGWESGAKVAIDLDGTPNDPSDDDEEWVVEMTIPLASLGVRPVKGAIVPLSLERCDKPKKGTIVCGRWSGTLVLD